MTPRARKPSELTALLPPRVAHVTKLAVSRPYRRWTRLLGTLDLDLDTLDSIDDLDAQDFLMCGPPRSGTALAAAMLFQPPRCVVAMEPWEAFRSPPRALIDAVRADLADGVLDMGRLDIAALESGEVVWCGDGESPAPVATDPATSVGVKVPGFWQYLGRLPHTRFVVCLRDPVDVVRSFARTDGRLREGLEYDIPFYGALNQRLERATDDPRIRRVLFLQEILEGILPHLDRPEVHVLRYERWEQDAEGTLGALGDFLGQDLGPPRVVVRPAPRTPPDPTLVDLIRRHAPAAAELGYPL